MPRISIQVTSEQQEVLEALATREGKSISDYLLERALPEQPLSEEEALRKLEDFLKPRIEAAEKGATSPRSVEQIFEDVRQQLK